MAFLLLARILRMSVATSRQSDVVVQLSYTVHVQLYVAPLVLPHLGGRLVKVSP